MKLSVIVWRNTDGGPVCAFALGAPTPSARKAKLAAIDSTPTTSAVATAVETPSAATT
jgi:hypothetical protein